jgi:lipid II:glycine glycyltransferase (peptidoglycan interpeptide bridge formation enzyme)
MIFENMPPESWNSGVNCISYSDYFGKANKDGKEIYYAYENNERALIIIRKKCINIFARAQIFTNSENKIFLERVLLNLKDRGIPYARIGNTMFGISNPIRFQNSELIKRHTFILDLEREEKEIWDNFDKKLRNVIRKAEKYVEIDELKKDEIEEYYKLSLETERDIKNKKKKKSFSIPSFQFFKSIFESKIGRFFVAKLEGKIIAGALFLLWKNKSIYYQSFLSRENRDKQAPSLIQWEAIKRFKKEGIKEYDLGGVTLNLSRDDSRFFVYEFKKKFNGNLKEFYNIEIELNKMKKLQDFLIKRVYG